MTVANSPHNSHSIALRNVLFLILSVYLLFYSDHSQVLYAVLSCVATAMLRHLLSLQKYHTQ